MPKRAAVSFIVCSCVRVDYVPGGCMEPIVADLVSRFEQGALTRRQLIQALSMLVAAPAAAVEGGQAPALHGTGIDHVSILVTDLQRSAAFYQRVFGMTQVSEDKPNQI